MSEKGTGDWYSSKEIYEKLMEVSNDFIELKGDIRETRTMLKQYNGLREEINNVKRDTAVIQEKVDGIINSEKGKHNLLENLRNWGGWIFGLLTLVILIYNQFIF